MKLTRNHLTIGFLALVALAAVAAVAGFPVTHYLPADVLAGLGALGAIPFTGEVKTIGEQVTAFTAKRQAAVDRMNEIMAKAAEEGRTLDEHEDEQYTTASSELKAIDAHLTRLKEHETAMVAKGVAVTTVATPGTEGDGSRGVEVRGGVVSVKRNLPPGIRFTRFAMAMAQAKGNVMLAHEIAKHYKDTPEVASAMQAAMSLGGTKQLKEAAVESQKAAVAFGTTTDATFVGPLVQYNDMESEFIDLLRPKMILGRMTQLNRIPFMSRMGRQLTGVSGSFVGEGQPKPVGKQTYDNVTLGFAKVAVIVVLSDEAVRFSSPSAEVKARDDMIKGISTYIDKRFMDPSYSGVANVSPASITNGATRIQSSGSTLAAIDADVANAMAMFANSEIDPATAVWVMSAATALRLSMKRNTNDEKAFPELTMLGGTWYGIPVIVSNTMNSSGSPAEKQIALVTQEEVFLADDGGVSIDMSNEASVQMDDAPSGGAQSLVSLWQNNLVGIRAEQYINWAPRRTGSLGIALIENVNY
jgi:HK97 family phage major capsid protein